VTTVLEPTSGPTTARRVPFPDAPWEGITRRHLQRIGVGPGWRCLVAAGGPSITGWLEIAVGESARPLVTDLHDGWVHGSGGAVLEVDTDAGWVPEGWFDLVLVRLGDVHVLDRAATVDRLLAALRPGGWMVVEDDVALPFELPAAGAVTGGSTPATVVEAIRRAAGERAAELDWARRVPDRLRARGCEAVAAEAHCSVWPGGAATIALPAEPAEAAGIAGLPLELEPFTRLVVNPFQGGLVPPALAAGSYVLFTTSGRR
jgi:hypothetical protein